MGQMHDPVAAALPAVTSDNFFATTDPVGPDQHFAAHHHDFDQLAQAQQGGMRVRVDNTRWNVTSEQFVWIPAHSEHELWMEGGSAIHSFYLHPSLRPAGKRWHRPMVLPVDTLAGGIVRHLCAKERPLPRRSTAFALLRDILEHTVESADVLAMPVHPAARVVAEALLQNPALERSLEEWARELGVSSKTLLRGFASETGTTFGQWRTRARTYRAAQLLSTGWSVQDAAAEVGYATATGFIKAYRSVYNATPAAHSARHRRSRTE